MSFSMHQKQPPANTAVCSFGAAAAGPAASIASAARDRANTARRGAIRRFMTALQESARV